VTPNGQSVSLWTRVVARAILATRAVDHVFAALDRGYRLFDRLRSELVAALAADAVLDRFNELVYGRGRTYLPGPAGSSEGLFPWEESIVRDFFPPPPARILVGGAGGGREALDLANRGYDVVGFDPSSTLVDAFAEHVAPGTRVRVHHASYAEMDSLVETYGPMAFDAAIIGWSSFSHLRDERSRIATLTSFAQLAKGPILVSFVPVTGPLSRRLQRFRRRLPRVAGRDPEGAFSAGIGFYRSLDEDDVRFLAREAGLDVVAVRFDLMPPHVVLSAPSS
jgi:hypothetical protein